MAQFVVEKDIEGLGRLSPFQRDQTVRRSCSPLHGISPDIVWVQSYLTDDKCFCVFEAPSEQALRELIDRMGIDQPKSIAQVHEVIGPAAND
ncbi:nickel-binding protein [Sphingomonas xanthus]|uniref:nickel-binding protein n=1 Tax=Sphingomonas xanthus TaxID=2594473 RepID=UPI00164EC27F|nr:nickel-binding protein [Sphingomonas xanthus]